MSRPSPSSSTTSASSAGPRSPFSSSASSGALVPASSRSRESSPASSSTRLLLEGTRATSIVDALSAKAGPLIQTLDNIKQRSCLSGLKLVFPQIIVLGEESSGKSSVLERLSMCEFFPRSEGICTRMPIQFEMIHKSDQEMREFCTTKKVPFVSNDCYCLVSSKRSTGEVIEYGFFGAADVREKVKPTMDDEVRRHNGDVRGVIDDVLNIAIIGQQVPDLTLLDLPGIVEGRRQGEPDDMSERTKALAVKYIKAPHSLILMVVPAYQRINCSSAGLLVQQYGKESMTLGVLTKADKYTIAKAFPIEELHGKLAGTRDDCIHLPHGYVAVANRDTASGPEVSLAESAAVEEAAFSTMPVRLRQRCGNAALMTRIVELLCDYTSKTWAPLAVREINAQISAQKLLLGSLGMSPTDAGLPQAALTEAVQLFERAVSHPEVAAQQWPTFPPQQPLATAGNDEDDDDDDEEYGGVAVPISGLDALSNAATQPKSTFSVGEVNLKPASFSFTPKSTPVAQSPKLDSFSSLFPTASLSTYRAPTESVGSQTAPSIDGESLNATRAWNVNKAAAENWLRDCLARTNPGISSIVSTDLRSHRKLPMALHRFHKLGSEIGTMLQRSVDRARARVCTPDNIRRRFEGTTAALEATNQENNLQRATTKLARMLQNEATIGAIDQFRNDLPQAFSVAGIFVEDSETSQRRRELTQLIAELTEVRELVESLSRA